MSGESFKPTVLTTFDGLQTYQGSAQQVPIGRSTSCQNVEFAPDRVYTRAGLTSMATFSAALLSIREYTLLNGSRQLLAFTADGTLSGEAGSYSFSNIATNLVELSVAQNAKMNSATLFGNEYIAIASNGLVGAALPRQYDGALLDRVAPGGPGSAPTVAAGAAGSIAAGARSFRVFFKTRNGYWTAPGPAFTIDLGGGTKANVTNIPTGPSWVVARVIAATPSCSSDFYFVAGSNMVLNDNTTTSITGIDFTDVTLISGTAVSSTVDPADDQMLQVELQPQAGCIAYNNRLIWWGERNNLTLIGDNGFRNLSFTGGFTGNIPNGWAQKVAGQSKGVTSSGALSDYLIITGNGATQTGCIENAGNTSVILPPGVNINCRLRLRKSAGAAAGTIHAYFAQNSTANGVQPFGGMSVDVSQLSSTEFRVLDAQILSAANNKSDSTWTLRLSGGGAFGTAITNGQEIDCISIEIYQADNPTNASLLRISKAFEPEAYDGLTGFMNVAEDNGQKITSCFILRGSLYIVKERSLFVTQDNGDEPDTWPINNVSETVGSPSARGVSVGEGWAMIAARGGLYFFTGGLPQKLIEEVQPTWDRINWAVGYNLWTIVDTEKRRIMVGAPFDGATTANIILALEWVGESPMADHDFGLWTVAANCGAFCERPDGTRHTLFGTSILVSSAQLGRLDDTARGNDFGGPVVSFYRTAFFGDENRIICGYMKANVKGNGNLSMTVWQADETTNVQISPSAVLANPSNNDYEWFLDQQGERLAFQASTSALNEWFSLQRLTIWTKPNPTAPVRGLTY